MNMSTKFIIAYNTLVMMSVLLWRMEGRRVPKFDVEFFQKSNIDKTRIIEFNAQELPGEECRRFIDLQNETILESQLECREILVNSCFYRLVTVYKAHQIKECKDHFKKDCYIGYEATKIVHPVKICRNIPVKDCSLKGPMECVDVYETICSSFTIEETPTDSIPIPIKEPECKTEMMNTCSEDVKNEGTASESCGEYPIQTCKSPKFVPSKPKEEPKCQQESKRVCGPAPCAIEYTNSCTNKNKTIVQELPQESCNLLPKKVCKNITKLIPSLETKFTCMDIPKEVCSQIPKYKKVTKTKVRKICKMTLGSWEPYGPWSPCSVSCGNGRQERRRKCDEEGKCKGFDSETRICSLPSCQNI